MVDDNLHSTKEKFERPGTFVCTSEKTRSPSRSRKSWILIRTRGVTLETSFVTYLHYSTL